MSNPGLSSLRGRLMASYVIALVLALAAFGGAAVFVIDRGLHTSLDQRLQMTAQAALNFVDVKGGRIEIDKRDRAQLFAILEPQTDLAIVGNPSGGVFSTTAKPSADLLKSAAQTAGFVNFRQGNGSVRALVLPISSSGKPLGALAVWTTAQWIKETDRRVAAAFAVAALLLAAVAAAAGTAVTRRALEAAFERERHFTADASHELRAPLSVIRAEADLALRKPRDPPAYQAALTAIAREADRMERLVGGLLSAARAETTGKPVPMDLQDMARGACTRLSPAADAKHVVLAFHEADACNVLADAGALESAATAVLHNAIKYTPPGGRIDVWAERRGRNAELYVRDGGPGFSPAALAHGLEWFWCDDRTRANGATGLGLAIANAIANASGGRLVLANASSGGAQVLISLPVHPAVILLR